MLRSDTLTSPAKKEDSSSITPDNIEQFFRVIADAAYDQQSPYFGLLTIFKRNFLEYLQMGLRNKIEKTFVNKKKLLHDQIKLLIKNKFFENKIDLAIIQHIQEDLAIPQNKLLIIVPEEDREDFLSLLRDIDNTCQSLHASTAKYFPDKIQTGMTQSEKRSLNCSHSYQAGSVSIELNNQGIQQFNKSEWQSAIYYFQAAIAAEDELSSQLKTAKNESAILIFKRNIVNAYGNWALSCETHSDFITSVQLAKNALKALDEIPSTSQTKNESEIRIRIQRILAYSTNCLGILLYQKKLYFSAINQFWIALKINNEIQETYVTEIEKINSKTFLQNIAYTFDFLGIEAFIKLDFDHSISYFQSAVKVIEKITEPLLEIDQYHLFNIYRNLAFALNNRGLKYYVEGNLAKAQQDYDLALKTIMKIPEASLTEMDKEAKQNYQNNLDCAVAQIEAAKSATLNPSRLFHHNNLDQTYIHEKRQGVKRTRSEEITPRPLKRARIFKSEPEYTSHLRKHQVKE